MQAWEACGIRRAMPVPSCGANLKSACCDLLLIAIDFFLVSALKYIYWRCLFKSGLRLKPQISILLTSSTCPETPEVECPKFCVFFVSGPSHCSLPFMSTHKWLCWLTLSNFLTVQQFHPHFVQLLQLQHLLIILKCVCFSSICTYSVFLILRTYRIQTTEFLKLSL